jgi:hypothetical protein
METTDPPTYASEGKKGYVMYAVIPNCPSSKEEDATSSKYRGEISTRSEEVLEHTSGGDN